LAAQTRALAQMAVVINFASMSRAGATRWIAAAATALALAAPTAGAAACPRAADGNDCDWTGTPNYISGTSRYDRGEFIYSDWVHDDFGANTDGFRSNNPDPPQPVTGIYPNTQNLASPRFGGTANNGLERFRHTGDYGYPANGTGLPTGYDDVADILEFREALDSSGLHVLVRLGALVNTDSSVVGIGIDADRDRATGAGEWPRGAGMTQQLGYDYFVTLWGTGGEITDYTGSTPVTRAVKVAANKDTRPPFIEADVPLPVDAKPGKWRTYVGSGIWNPTANAWQMAMPTSGQTAAPGSLGRASNIYNLLFRPHEPNNWWRDTTQADDLANHDISGDHADVDMEMLAARKSSPPVRPTGLLNVQYRTVPLGNGQGTEASAAVIVPIGNEIYKGPIQPYTLVLPTDYYKDKHPRRFVFFYHCANCNHNIWPFGVESVAVGGQNGIDDTTIETTHIQDIVDRNDIMVAGSVQRGEVGPGATYGNIPGAGEKDLRDVYDTLRTRDKYSIDPNRVVFSGMSMGGSTTNTLMTLYPDELAAAVSHSSASVPARLPNIRNVYYMQITGDTGLDAPAPSTGRQAATAMTTLGYRHMYIEYIGRAHDFGLVYESLPIVEKTGWRQVRDPNPGRVTFVRERATEGKYDINHDHAYWASGLDLPKDAASAQIDAISLPLAYKLPKKTSHVQGTFVNPDTGNQTFVDWLEWDRDLTGHGLQDFQPGWQPGPDVSVTNADVPPPEHAGVNGFSATTSYASQTLDLDRMQVDVSKPATGYIDAQNSTSFTLTTAALGGERIVKLDGNVVSATRTANALTVAVPAGKHVLTIGAPSCIDRRKFTFRIHQPLRGRITSVTIYVNGKRTRTVKATRVTRVTVSKLPRKTFKVRIVARSNSGRRTISTRTYRGCKKSAPHTVVHGPR
jgi:opacity protein-like surface antigen